MLSRKTRMGAYVAACAVAALLAIPAVGQALWSDDESVSPDGGLVQVTAYASASSAPQTVSVSYDTDGPSFDGPDEVVIPAGSTSVTFPVEVGAGFPGQSVWVGAFGSSVITATTIWLE
jgi:hypothetical protein